MKTENNLNAYFERIGYTGPHEASLEVLKELHLLHPAAIAFENLNPLLGIPVLLDPQSIHQKLINENRGGYCFEQNLLFMQVLRFLGFSVRGLAARVLWNVPEGQITPRGHMLLLVEAEGVQYVADVGFGGQVATAPLLLEAGKIQETPHELYQLKKDGDDFILRTKVRETWKPMYRFNLVEHFREDYEVTNWYLSNHPASHFVTGLIAARADINPHRRYTLRGNEFSTHYLHGETEKQLLTTVTALKEILQQKFLIDLSGLPGLDAALEKMTGKEKEVA